MNKSFHIVIILIVLVFWGCNSSSVSEDNKGVMYKDIPSTAYSVAENDSVIVFLNEECIEDSMEGLSPIKQVSLWMYNRNKIEGRRILLSHPNTNMLLVEGCSDYRNVKSFSSAEDSANAICLPTNRGLIGISEEDGLLIMQSYDYYEDGGRYNIIEAFDVKGIRVSSMNAKTRN